MAAILTDPPDPGGARCPGCGASFGCAIDAAGGCWCATLPTLGAAPVPGLGCLCPACLGRAIERERAADPARAAERARALAAAGIDAVPHADEGEARARVDAAWAAKTMPAGALGRLQSLGTRLALSTGRLPPDIGRCAVVVFAGDHGLAAEGVSAYPPEVTAQMVRAFGEGGAAIAVLCREHGLALTVVDAGTRTPQPADFAPRGTRFVDARIGAGTANALHGPAMSETQALEAIRRGAAIARDLEADAIGLGEMGIGNSASAALLAARLVPAPIGAVVGRGTGLDDAGLARKRAVLARCLAAHPGATTPLAALAAFGGFELAMIVGATLAATARRVPVVVDGFIASAAVLVAARLEPAVLEHCTFAHRSVEPGHGRVLEALGAEPLLDLGLRLGEGSGAALAMPMLRAASRLLREMATFDSAGVAGRAPQSAQ
jgi:nicotinate-nucleotide--dimethylbenzimidazole phosphoribosyltransferase